MSVPQGGDDSYPASWFPKVSRQMAQRRREEVLRQLVELPDEVLARALDEARKLGTGSEGAA